MRSIYERAHARGEIDLNRLPNDVLEMPLDLVRHDFLMTPGRIDAARIRSIVDDLLIHLVRRA